MPGKDPFVLLDEAIEALAAIEDPATQAKTTTEFLTRLLAANEQVGEIRKEAVKTLSDIGWGYQRIADFLGLSKARAQQLSSRMPAVKRAGVIETQTRIMVAELRASGASDDEIVKRMVPRVREYRGGAKVTAQQLSEWLDIPEEQIAPALASAGSRRS